jgi:hypothetical protein
MPKLGRVFRIEQPCGGGRFVDYWQLVKKEMRLLFDSVIKVFALCGIL